MKVINLQGNKTSFILVWGKEHVPRCVYWGDKIDLSNDDMKQILSQNEAVPQATLIRRIKGAIPIVNAFHSPIPPHQIQINSRSRQRFHVIFD